METLERKPIGLNDSKTRRRSNISNRVANITAEEIENGVDIETLEKINVPVFRYQTQITIHGKLPGLSNYRVMGYKSLFENANGSIGVKYVAIDGKKKSIIVSAYNLCKETTVSVLINSQGLVMQRRVATNCKPESMEKGRELIDSVPNCFVGSKYLCRDAFGCLYAVIELGSIYWNDLFTLIDWLTLGKIKNESDLERLKIERENRRAKEKEAAAIEYEKQKAEIEVKRADMINKWESEGFKYFDGEKFDGLYIIRPATYSKYAYNHILFRKWGCKFKSSTVETDSRERLPESMFSKWKNPNSVYRSNAKGFMPKA